ncbi:MAG: glycosyltransferase family 2 protein [Collinsella sp.]
MKQLCIFTPTYNREHTLKRLYESLKKQTDSRFYWLVVDDGSTDGTQSLFDSFAKESAIEIEYIKVANGGKQRACNLAAEKCTSELFMCVDSDDYLTPDAVHFILTAWKM